MSDLLPPNATELERAVSHTLDRPVPVPIATLWNPDTCPDALLPWLAWTFSVDTWDASWPAAQKRAVIKASVDVHSRKGTIGALRSALGSLGLEIEISEWFQKEPAGDPYTFALGVVVDQVGIATAGAFDDVVDVAMAAKNLRSHMTGVDVLARSHGGVSISALYVFGETVTLEAEPA